MQISKWEWRDWVVFVWCVGLGLVALVTLWPGWGKAWPWLADNSGNVATWVQAVGSIAAIVAGFRVAEKTLKVQHEQQRVRDAETKRVTERMQYLVIADRLNATAVWAEAAVADLNRTADDDTWVLVQESAHSVSESLRAITADQIPSADAIHRLHMAALGVGGVSRFIQIARHSKQSARARAFIGAEAWNRAKSVAALAAVDRDFCIDEAKKLSTADEILRAKEMEETRKAAFDAAFSKYR